MRQSAGGVAGGMKSGRASCVGGCQGAEPLRGSGRGGCSVGSRWEAWKVLLHTVGTDAPRLPYVAELFPGCMVGQVRRTEVAAGGGVVNLDAVVVVGHEPGWGPGCRPGRHPRPHVVRLRKLMPRVNPRATACLYPLHYDPQQLAQLEDATVCHGWVGLLMTRDRIASDATTPTIANELPVLRSHLDAHMGAARYTRQRRRSAHAAHPHHPPFRPGWETYLFLTNASSAAEDCGKPSGLRHAGSRLGSWQYTIVQRIECLPLGTPRPRLTIGAPSSTHCAILLCARNHWRAANG